MSNLSDFDWTVLQMIIDFGGTATLQIQGDGVYNPDTSDYDTSVTPYPCQAILLDLELRNNGLQTVPSTLIQAGDKRIFVRPVNKTDPTVQNPMIQPNKDKITMAGIEYKIVTLKETNPTGADLVLIELFVRQ